MIQSSIYDGVFTHWLKIPYINYLEVEEEEEIFKEVID